MCRSNCQISKINVRKCINVYSGTEHLSSKRLVLINIYITAILCGQCMAANAAKDSEIKSNNCTFSKCQANGKTCKCKNISLFLLASITVEQEHHQSVTKTERHINRDRRNANHWVEWLFWKDHENNSCHVSFLQVIVSWRLYMYKRWLFKSLQDCAKVNFHDTDYWQGKAMSGFCRTKI